MDLTTKLEQMKANFPDAVRLAPEDRDGLKTDNPLIREGAPMTGVLHPRNPDELQRMIRAANADDINLTVTSSGGPHRRGGIAGCEPNALIDLAGWNQVEWINRRNRVCLIQPGVTFSALLSALAGQGMTISMPLAPRNGKSVLAAVMDREPSTWPNRQWDISDPAASTEFIFGNGERFRTGAGAGPGSLEEQRKAGGAHKSPLGPSQADFHRVVQGAQGTMGILTWISLRTELMPSVRDPNLLSADALEKLIPFVYDVQRPWLGEHAFVLNGTAAAMLMAGAGKNKFDSLRETLPPFIHLQNIAGFERFPKERVAYQRNDIGKLAARAGLKMEKAVNGLSAMELLTTSTTPCGETDWRNKLKGNCLSVFFLTTLDKVPAIVSSVEKMTGAMGIAGENLGLYVQPVVQNHGCHVEFMIPYNPADNAEVERMRRVERELVEHLMGLNVFFSRPYGAAQETVFQRNPMNYEVLRKIKGIFDPNRILNRGKWGL